MGPIAALALLASHLAGVAEPRRELIGVGLVASVGTSWDVVPATLGLIDYRGGIAQLGGVPLWIAALWFAFATTLNVSLRWLRRSRVLTVLLGAAFGPLSYLAASALGALVLVDDRGALLLQCAAWAVLLPAAVAVAQFFDGTIRRRHV
jgi:hypothetical protein